MKLIRIWLLAGILASLLTACTYVDPGQEQEPRPVESSPAPSTPPAAPVRLEGEFQSQAAATTGMATIEVNEAGAVLRLENMAVHPGKNLRVMLSPGTLAPGADGGPALSSTRMIEIGPFRAGATQRFVMDSGTWAAIREPVRSVLIYDYATKAAYGTANLSGPPDSPGAPSAGRG